LQPSPDLFAELRRRELKTARTFKECTGISMDEIEELCDATMTALLTKTFASEEHLRNTLHQRIKWGALNLHRSRVIHHRVLEQVAPAVQSRREEQAWDEDPQRAVFAHEDDFFLSEFLAELTKVQRAVFALMADGQRAIATALNIEANLARKEVRCCERQRKIFLTIYKGGRLCDYRSHAIHAILSGQKTKQSKGDAHFSQRLEPRNPGRAPPPMDACRLAA
jgi:hypothetical protein